MARSRPGERCQVVVPSVPVFGFSLSELIVVIVVALVVIGPKDLPKMLRKLGQYAGKLRRMASDLRAQSGIDEALRTEGLADPIAEIRKLARGELDAVTRAVDVKDLNGSKPADISAREAHLDGFHVVRDRELITGQNPMSDEEFVKVFLAALRESPVRNGSQVGA